MFNRWPNKTRSRTKQSKSIILYTLRYLTNNVFDVEPDAFFFKDLFSTLLSCNQRQNSHESQLVFPFPIDKITKQNGKRRFFPMLFNKLQLTRCTAKATSFSHTHTHTRIRRCSTDFIRISKMATDASALNVFMNI